MYRLTFIALFHICSDAISQGQFPHVQAHAHNDYEHTKPLWNALENGFISVEADVYLIEGKLKVSHEGPKPGAGTLEQLYLRPLDSLLKRNNGRVYPDYPGTFYLMIDSKTEAESTYRAIQNAVAKYEPLLCKPAHCPVKIFISGNRAVDTMIKEGYQGLALDGRPNDVDKGISSELIPVISDHYSNWSTWKGNTDVTPDDLSGIRELAQRVHTQGKKLRLWAIPDHENAWEALLNAGVDFINTDHLEDLHQFLIHKDH